MPTSLKGLRPAATSEGSAGRAPNAGVAAAEDRATGPGPEPAPRQPGRGSRFLGNAPIRVKVVLITLVPLMAMFLFAGILTFIVTDEAQSAQQVQQLARVGSQASQLVNDLQIERSAAAGYVSSPGTTPDAPTLLAFKKQTVATDNTLRQFIADSSRLDADTKAPISSELTRVTQGAQSLSNSRSNILDQARGPGVGVDAAASKYQSMIGDLLLIGDKLAANASDQSLSDQLGASAAFSHYKEYVGEEQVTVLDVLKDNNKQFNSASYSQFLTARAFQSTWADTFRNNGNVTQRTQRNDILTAEGAYRDLSNTANKAQLIDKIPFDIDNWTQASDKENSLLRSVETKLNADDVAAAGDFRDSAIRKTIIVITVALAALVVALLVSLAVARSMVRPLVRLRSSALEVAYQSLPEVVRRLQDADQHTAAQATAETKARSLDIRSGDEIGQVAQAFNAVHLEAVRVASEQAQLRQSVSTMFVNLSRRSQLLVDRLIRLIDGLEQGERDPDRLSELFKLDHLATRMRRNDENLLVLAGADAGRRWTRPAPLVDVLRAATAEVEQYTRVKLGSIDDTVEISASAVNDLVHLVAEILENATSFSSPRTDVVVDSRRVGDHVIIEIEDQGIGMSREQLAEFNERLAKPPVFDIAVSRMMGLFVVGRLASRHGVKVMLRDASGGGVLAIVTLPTAVLHGDQPAPVLTPAAGPDDEHDGERPVERIVSERVDRTEQPALPAASNPFPGEQQPAPYAATANFGQNAQPTQPTHPVQPPPFGRPPGPGETPYAPTAPFGAEPPFGNYPHQEAEPTPFAASPVDGSDERPDDPWRPAATTNPFTPRGDDRDAQREAFGPPNRVPGASGISDLFSGQRGQQRDERQDTGFNPSPFGPPPTPAQPAQPPAAATNPVWEEPTRQVPIVGDTAAGATGTHRILGDLRPEQLPADPREPDLTWSGGSGLVGRRPAGEEPVQSSANQPGQPASPSPLPVREPFAANRSDATAGRNESPATTTQPLGPPVQASAPAAETVRPGAQEPARGSAADAMASLRREASNDRTGNTGPQKVFRAGPSDPPSSDPTIEMPLPIFDAIESEWFRTRTTAAPQRNGNGNGSWTPPRVPEAPGARSKDEAEQEQEQEQIEEIPVSPAVGNGASFPQPATAAWNRPRPEAAAPTPNPPQRPEPVAEPVAPPPPEPREPVGVGAARQPAEQAANGGWESPADTGWRAAQAAAQAAAEPSATSTTQSGLPKRVPMAHFVPGRVEPPGGKKPARPATHRSPEAVRGVLSSYRSGLEQGRQAGRPTRTGTTFAGSPDQEEM